LLLTFVLPRLTTIFKVSGVELPKITKFFIFLSNVLNFSKILDLVVLGLLIWFFIYFRKTVVGQHLFLSIAFRLPVIKELIKKVVLTRFSRTLGGLIGSGTNIVDALELSSEATGNIFYQRVLTESREQIKSGTALSETLQNKSHLFPNLLINLIGVGEKTGTLDYVLKTFSDFYDQEIDSTLKDLTTFLEPILLLIMGVLIGAVALSILLPIYQLVGNFS
jgi:type II secretory pathway component PulF